MKYFWKIQYVVIYVHILSNLCFSNQLVFSHSVYPINLHIIHHDCMIFKFEARADVFSQEIINQNKDVLYNSLNTFLEFKLSELSNFTHLASAYFNAMNDHRRFTQNCSIHLHYFNSNQPVAKSGDLRYQFLTKIIIPLETVFGNRAKIILPFSYPKFVYLILYDKVINLNRGNINDLPLPLHGLLKNLYKTWQYKTVYYSIINNELYAICIHCRASGHLNKEVVHKVGATIIKDANSLLALWQDLNNNCNGLEVANNIFNIPKELYNKYCNRINQLSEHLALPETCLANEIMHKLNLTFVARPTDDSIEMFQFVFEISYDTLINREFIIKKTNPGLHMSSYCKVRSAFRLGFYAHINFTSYNLTAALLPPVQIQTFAYLLLISFTLCLALQLLWMNSIATNKDWNCTDCSGMFYGLAIVLNQYNSRLWERARSNQRFFSVVYGSWLIIVFFICMHYSSVLTSYLTKSPSIKTPCDLNELIFDEKWKHIPIISTSHVIDSSTKAFYLRHQILVNSRQSRDTKDVNFLFDKIYSELNKRLVELESFEQGILFHKLTYGIPVDYAKLNENDSITIVHLENFLVQGLFAIIDYESDLVLKEILAKRSGLYTASQYSRETGIEETGRTIAFQKRFPGEVVNFVLAWLDNTGVYQKIQQDCLAGQLEKQKQNWDRSNEDTYSFPNKQVEHINFEIVWKLFMYLLYIYSFILVFWCLEFLSHCCKKLKYVSNLLRMIIKILCGFQNNAE